MGDQADFVATWTYVTTGRFASELILDHIDCDSDPSMEALAALPELPPSYVVADIAQGVIAIHRDPRSSELKISVGAASWSWDDGAPTLDIAPADVMTGTTEACEVWLDPAPGLGG